MIGTILLVFAFVCAVLATLGVPSHPRFALGWASLAFFFASELFGQLGHLTAR